MQWLQDPSRSSVGNLNNVRREAMRHFKNKKKDYLNAKIEQLETNSKIKNVWGLYRDISDIKKGDQPRTNIIKDEKGDLVRDSHGILASWRNHLCHLLNVHGVNDVRQNKIYTAEPLVSHPHAVEFEFVLAIEKLKSHKSTGIGQIPAELFKAVGRTIRYKVHKLIIIIIIIFFFFSKEDLPEAWKESIIVRIYKKGDKTD